MLWLFHNFLCVWWCSLENALQLGKPRGILVTSQQPGPLCLIQSESFRAVRNMGFITVAKWGIYPCHHLRKAADFLRENISEGRKEKWAKETARNWDGRRAMATGELPKQTRREGQRGQWAQQDSADRQKILPANPRQPNRKDNLSQWVLRLRVGTELPKWGRMDGPNKIQLLFL